MAEGSVVKDFLQENVRAAVELTYCTWMKKNRKLSNMGKIILLT
jgi:hypothetical protein